MKPSLENFSDYYYTHDYRPTSTIQILKILNRKLFSFGIWYFFDILSLPTSASVCVFLILPFQFGFLYTNYTNSSHRRITTEEPKNDNLRTAMIIQISLCLIYKQKLVHQICIQYKTFCGSFLFAKSTLMGCAIAIALYLALCHPTEW